MENFVVSARKYRPGTFDSVVGQSHVTETLKNAIRNQHLAHAFLFCGPRGVGKTTCARILAKTINCKNLTEQVEPCNECDSCQAFNSNSSFNIYELDAASNNSVEDIRSLVEQVRYAPQGAKYKIYIIDEVHMLSQSAFNAFLKTLEEPPEYAIFILATTEKHKILPTILSRCQIFDFKRIGIDHMTEHLQSIVTKEQMQAEPEALHTIATKADGALRDALSIFDRIVSFSGNTITYQDVITNLNILDYEYYFKLVDFLNQENLSESLLLFDEILKKGFDGLHFLTGLSAHLRDLLVSRSPETQTLLEVTENLTQRYTAQAQSCSESFLINALNITNQGEVHFKGSNNQRLHVELTLMKLCHIQSMVRVGAVATNDSSKKKADTVTQTSQAPKAKSEAIKPQEQAETKTAEPAEPTSSTNKEHTPAKESTDSGEPEAPSKSQPESAPVSANTTRLGNIQSIRSRMNKPETESKEELPETPITSTPDQTFNEEDLVSAWNAYTDHLGDEGKKSLQMLLRSLTPKLKNEHLITLEVFENVHRQNIEDDKSNLMPFLRKTLQNRAIELEINLVKKEGDQEKKIFTAEDKYKALVEANPLMLELKNKLGLELDY